jgi:glycosyltransferase involved in cell wall biosynthesis
VKIALLTKYGHLAASTRQRFEQYQPFLQQVGFDMVSYPLLDDVYLTQVYAGGKADKIQIAAQYWKRMRWLFSRPEIDLIWLHCELFPYLPGFVEQLVRAPSKPVVFDYDDAIFHNYDLSPNRLVRSILGRKLQSTISAAQLVLCGNAYLARYAQSLCLQTEIVPTVVDTTSYFPRPLGSSKMGPLRIGWIGTPSTWTEYMVDLLPTLIQVAQTTDARLAVMGAVHNAKGGPLVDFVRWSETGEVPFLQDVDIGIMPLTDTPWARGKCGYKLIQYMACGLPVIASPVGVNAEIVEDGVNGFLVQTEAEWRSALTRLLRDADLRHRMGQAGRAKVEAQYSLQVWGPRVAEMLIRAAKRGAA